MFNDQRSKKIIFVAHCILNQNSISDGTADFPATVKPILDFLIKENVGIIQLPCPELNCLGLDRGNPKGSQSDVIIENTRIKGALKNEIVQKKLQLLIGQIVYQIEEYLKHNFNIIGLIGINRSPSCGVETTSKNNQEAKGKGFFTSLLLNELDKKNINLKMLGIKTSNLDEALEKVSQLF